MKEPLERLPLRVPEAAARLGLGRSAAGELIQSGELPAVRMGMAVRITASRLAAAVETQALAVPGSGRDG